MNTSAYGHVGETAVGDNTPMGGGGGWVDFKGRANQGQIGAEDRGQYCGETDPGLTNIDSRKCAEGLALCFPEGNIGINMTTGKTIVVWYL